MGCAEKDCCTKGAATGAIAFPGTNEPNTPWKLYNHLIAGVPEDAAREAMRLASHKLPCKTKIVAREAAETENGGEN